MITPSFAVSTICKVPGVLRGGLPRECRRNTVMSSLEDYALEERSRRVRALRR